MHSTLSNMKRHIVDTNINVNHFASRIFKKLDEFMYFGNVHEELRYNNVSLDSYITISMILTHDGYKKNIIIEKDKYRRNIELLKLCVLTEPSNPRWKYFYIIEKYYAEKDIETLKKEIDNLEILKLSKVMQVKALELKANIYIMLNHDISEVINQYNVIAPNCIDSIYFSSLNVFLRNINNIYENIKNTCVHLNKLECLEVYSTIDNDNKHIYELLINMSKSIGNDEFVEMFSKKGDKCEKIFM